MENTEDLKHRVESWVGQCLRKKKLKEKWANTIIQNAQKTGDYLRKYKCPHCDHYHVTSRREFEPKGKK